jgi:aspartate aminotransferase-like enzyme
MDMAAANLIEKEIMYWWFGYFGKRFKDIFRSLWCKYNASRSPLGETVSLEAIVEKELKPKQYKAFDYYTCRYLYGNISRPETYSQLAKKYNTFILDGVCSVAGKS